MVEANIEYYLPRTTHGSTLSKMIFATVCMERKMWTRNVERKYADSGRGEGEGEVGEVYNNDTINRFCNHITKKKPGICSRKALEAVSFIFGC